MAGNYRGILKVAGSAFRGWLIDTARPDRRIRFDLVIDGETRGTYAANRRRRFLVRQSGASEDTHGFSIPIRKIWISGEAQRVRIEDPADPSLEMVLTAKLGPAANTHFEDHVVSGQVSIGDGDSAPRQKHDRVAEEEADHRPANKALLKQLAALGDAELAALLAAVDREIVVERLKNHEKSGDWQAASAFRRAMLGPAAGERLTALGRNAMKAHNYGIAARLNTAAAALHPQSFEANLLAGSAKSMQGEFDEALRFLRAADRLEEGTARARRELVTVLARQLRGELSAGRREDARAEHLSLLRGLSSSQDAATRMAYRVPFATALYAAGRYEEAIAASDRILEDSPHDPKALMIKARALVARNQIAEAHALYERILEFDPGHRGAKMNLRVLAALTEDEAGLHDGAGRSVAGLHHFGGPDGGTAEKGEALARSLARLPQSWVCTTRGYADDRLPQDLQSLLDVNAARRLGYAEIGLSDGRRLEFWRRDALLGLAESGLLTSLDDSVALNRWKPFYGTREHAETTPRATRRGVAALISRNGAELYGGGEHFLENVAEHHAEQGFEPVIVGTRPELKGEERSLNGYRCIFLGDTPSEIRRFLLENEVSLVHAISGVGFSVAEALNFTNVPFVYGVHFWNELLGDPQQSGYFDDVTGASRSRHEFRLILSRATAIYANSRYTQKIIEEGFGVRCPIVYAVPRERVRKPAQH